jgi:hypothetical protein
MRQRWILREGMTRIRFKSTSCQTMRRRRIDVD